MSTKSQLIEQVTGIARSVNQEIADRWNINLWRK